MTKLPCVVVLAILHFASVAAAQTPTLRPGDEAVSGADLVPYYARYSEHLANGAPPRERLVILQEASYPGGDGLRLLVAMRGAKATVYDEVQLLRAHLEPILRSVSALTLLHQLEVIDGSEVHGYRIAKDGSTGEPFELTMEGRRFYGGTVGLVLAGQTLSLGSVSRLAVFSSDLGPAEANLVTEIRVRGRERLEAAGRAFETWKVESRNLDTAGRPLTLADGSELPSTTLWIAREPPYVIRSQWGTDHVVEVVDFALLASGPTSATSHAE